MSSHENLRPEDLPPFETHIPTLDEVIQRINNGTLGELADPASTSQQQIVFFGERPPRPDASVYSNTEGQIVYPFSRKFMPGQEMWQPGDRVRARMRVKKDEDGSLSLRTITGRGDHDDIYELRREYRGFLSQLGMAYVDADMLITGPGSNVVSRIDVYPATIDHIHSVETLWDGQSPIAPGTTALAQGQVVAYEEGAYTSQARTSAGGSVQLRLESGEEVRLKLSNVNLYINRGAIDVIEPPSPQLGDVIQVRVVGDSTTGAPSARNGAYLSAPAPERRIAYEQAQADINRRIEELNELDAPDFRRAAAELMHAHTSVRETSHATDVNLLMSPQQFARLYDAHDARFPRQADGTCHPESMLMLSGRSGNFHRTLHYMLLDMGREYRFDALKMSGREYFDFCQDVAFGRIQRDASTEIRSFPLGMLHNNYRPSEVLKFLHEVIQRRMPYYQSELTRETQDRNSRFIGGPVPITENEHRLLCDVLACLGDLAKKDAAAKAYGQRLFSGLHEQWQFVYSFTRDVMS